MTRVEAYYTPALAGIFGLPHLRHLQLERLSGAQRLESLDLRAPGKLPSIGGTSPLAALTSLTIIESRLESLAGLTSYPNLATLRRDGVRLPDDLAALATLSGLRRLSLIDCGPISDVHWLTDLRIQEIFIYGSTNILDGDLSPLDSSDLTTAAIRPREHYNRTEQQLLLRPA